MWESQHSAAGRAPFPLATGKNVPMGRRSYMEEVYHHHHRDASEILRVGRVSSPLATGESRQIPCLECGQLGHGIFSCPRFWGAC